jgi:glycosyltransferase involved in cell wall biosynthesis
LSMSRLQQRSVVVSVILPIFNVSQYIPGLIEQLRKQQTTQAEFIFIDDGSTDGSSELLDQLALDDNHIVIHQQNRGVATARNTGLSAAQGRYVCFIDPDDNISNNYLHTLIRTASSTSAEVVLTDWAKIRGTETIHNKISNTTTNIELSKTNVFREILENDSILCSLWGKLFATHLFSDNCFPDQRTCSDYVPCFTALQRAKSIWYAPGTFYFYTSDRNSSLQNTQTASDIKDSVSVHQVLAAYVKTSMPELKPAADLDLAHARVQACVHICKSSKITNKRKLFYQYSSGVRQFTIRVWRGREKLSDKALFTLISAGYLMTSLSLKLREWLR